MGKQRYVWKRTGFSPLYNNLAVALRVIFATLLQTLPLGSVGAKRLINGQ